MKLSRTGTWATYVLLVIMLIPTLMPLLWMLSVSLRENNSVFELPLKFLPDPWTWEAFVAVLTDPDKIRLFVNSYVISLSTMAISVTLAALAGYGFSRFRFRGRAAVISYVLLTQMFPLVLLTIPYFIMISGWGLYDTTTAMVIACVSFALPFAILMLRDFVDTVPVELDEAAKLDGAGPFRTFFSIILPTLRPGLVATGTYAFILAWNEFLFGVVLTSTTQARPLTVGIATLKGEFSTTWNEIMALSVLGSIPLIVAFFFLQKQFVQGITSGSVK